MKGLDLQTKKIAYKQGDIDCQDFLAWDDAIQGPPPGMLVMHEWWGLDDYQRRHGISGRRHIRISPAEYHGYSTRAGAGCRSAEVFSCCT